MEFINDENPVVLNRFLSYLLNIKHYSKTTINEYRLDVLLFFRFIKLYHNLSIGVKDFTVFILHSIREDDIYAFLVHLNINRSCTACTRRRRVYGIKCFYKWFFTVYSNKDIMKNPIEDIPYIQDVERLPKYLTLAEAKSIIGIFDVNNCKFPVRNNTIIALFLNCGLRASELINIKISDLDLCNGYIRIIGKCNKERICYLNVDIKEQLSKYLDYLKVTRKNVNMGDLLFVTRLNTRFSLRDVEIITQRAYELAGLGHKGYTTHTLRHTIATIMYENNPDILLLKNFLGHSTIKATEIYTHICNDRVRCAVNNNPLSNYIK